MRRPTVRTLSWSGILLAAVVLAGGISWTYAAPPDVPATAPARLEIAEFPVPRGSGPHDVAPAVDGGVWYTAQRSGEHALPS